jgi:hypothetical protein
MTNCLLLLNSGGNVLLNSGDKLLLNSVCQEVSFGGGIPRRFTRNFIQTYKLQSSISVKHTKSYPVYAPILRKTAEKLNILSPLLAKISQKKEIKSGLSIQNKSIISVNIPLKSTENQKIMLKSDISHDRINKLILLTSLYLKENE